MSSLRDRLSAEIQSHIVAVNSSVLQDLWGRSKISVMLERLVVEQAAGRPGKGMTRVSGTARASVVADYPDLLPDERVWARLTLSRSLPDAEGYAHIGRCQLVRVEERVMEGWAVSDLVFDFDGTLPEGEA